MKTRIRLFELIFVLALVGLVYGLLAGAEEIAPAGDWQLVEMNGRPLVPGSLISLEFTTEGLGGYSGCNSFGGSYETGRSGGIRMNEIAMTAMACPEPAGVMEQESAFMQALQSVRRIAFEENRMRMVSEQGLPILVFSPVQRFEGQQIPLERTHWILASIDGIPLDADPAKPVSIRFTETEVGGYSGCRHFSGTYEVDGDAIFLTSLRMMEYGCESEAQQALEQRFLETIDRFKLYHLDGYNLIITLITGEELVYEPIPISRDADPENAKKVIQTFSRYLSDGQYDQAASLYLGPYETLREYNPGIAADDFAALLAAGCANQFRCLPLRSIVDTQLLTFDTVLVTVTFKNEDGTPFVLGPCCGDESPAPETPTRFEWIVQDTVNGSKVYGGLVYVP